MNEENKVTPSQEPVVANLYLETLIAKVDTNKYRLIRKLINASHEFLEDEADPLHESVDNVLRNSAIRLVKETEAANKQDSVVPVSDTATPASDPADR